MSARQSHYSPPVPTVVHWTGKFDDGLNQVGFVLCELVDPDTGTRLVKGDDGDGIPLLLLLFH